MLRHGHILLPLALLALASCEDGGNMRDQPRYEALEPSTFFEDGSSARPLPAGTIARGQLPPVPGYNTGHVGGEYLQRVPMDVTLAVLERGRERFNIFCSPCHSYDGDGDGMIVRRGFTAPPSFHIERLRLVPDGYIFSVITDGFGRMPSYAAPLQPTDRWAVIAYVRALQLSQHADVAQLPEPMRQELEEVQP